MARILIGWELGGNRGHAVQVMRIARALRGAGHDVMLALQRLDALDAADAEGCPVWQAPVTPRLLVGSARPASSPAAGMADILARVGFDDSALVAAMLGGWHRLFEAIRPDLVVADFAPFLLLAARGRVPAVAIGNGFTLPPALADSFPALIEGQAQAVDQSAMLETVNRGLSELGAPPVDALPQLFGAERSVVATFAELDPYAGQRREPTVSPLPSGAEPVAGEGEELFVYLPETIDPEAPLWAGLAEAGLPTRVHVPKMTAGLRDKLVRLGLTAEPEPLPFRLIAARSRLLLSHGGHGFLSAGMAAGLASIVCHYDLEKLVYGLALARAGIGGHASLGAIVPRTFAQSLLRVYGDEALAARARAAGVRLRATPIVPFDEAVVEAASALT